MRGHLHLMQSFLKDVFLEGDMVWYVCTKLTIIPGLLSHLCRTHMHNTPLHLVSIPDAGNV